MNNEDWGYCKRCGRKLISKESKELGFGKSCFKKYLIQNNPKNYFKLEEENTEINVR